MLLYELITPSDSITFKAKNDKVAMACALVLGQGQAGARRIDSDGNEVKIPSLTIFNQNASADIESFLQTSLADYLKNNEQDIAECFKTFGYTTLDNRNVFDKELNKCKNDKEVGEFLTKHENKKRTSMSRWVTSAWSYGRALTNKIQMENVSKQ